MCYPERRISKSNEKRCMWASHYLIFICRSTVSPNLVNFFPRLLLLWTVTRDSGLPEVASVPLKFLPPCLHLGSPRDKAQIAGQNFPLGIDPQVPLFFPFFCCSWPSGSDFKLQLCMSFSCLLFLWSMCLFFLGGGLVLCVRVVWWWHHLRVFYLLWGLENILSLFALGEHPEHPVTKMLVTAVLTISYQSWITNAAFVLMKKTVSLKQSRVEWFNFIEAGIFHSPYRMFKTTP